VGGPGDVARVALHLQFGGGDNDLCRFVADVLVSNGLHATGRPEHVALSVDGHLTLLPVAASTATRSKLSPPDSTRVPSHDQSSVRTAQPPGWWSRHVNAMLYTLVGSKIRGCGGVRAGGGVLWRKKS
jgi:hypothetical protein